jgi:hypothetical protein
VILRQTALSTVEGRHGVTVFFVRFVFFVFHVLAVSPVQREDLTGADAPQSA